LTIPWAAKRAIGVGKILSVAEASLFRLLRMLCIGRLLAHGIVKIFHNLPI